MHSPYPQQGRKRRAAPSPHKTYRKQMERVNAGRPNSYLCQLAPVSGVVDPQATLPVGSSGVVRAADPPGFAHIIDDCNLHM